MSDEPLEPGKTHNKEEKIEKVISKVKNSKKSERLRSVYKIHKVGLRLSAEDEKIIAKKFLCDIGHSGSNIFNSVTYEHTNNSYTFDIVISSSPGAEPWATVNIEFFDPEFKHVFPGHRGSQIQHESDILEELHKATKSEHTIKFSDRYVIIVSDSIDNRPYPAGDGPPGMSAFGLEEIEPDSYNEIENILSPPDTLPKVEDLSSGTYTNKIINTNKFKMDLRELARHYNRVTEAEKPIRKGREFESLSRLLVGGLVDLDVYKKNPHTGTSELDLIAKNTTQDISSIFYNHDRFILFECKNWSEKVGAKEVRDFIGKMDRTRADWGILFSKNGISGEDGKENAGRVIADKFQREGKAITVVDERDIKSIFEGKSFYEILEQKMVELRFDL